MADNKDKELRKLREENKKLKEELLKRDGEIQSSANKSVVERWKIGRYLHDNLAQQLTTARLSISLLKEELTLERLETICEEIIEVIDKCITNVRNLSHDIIPMDVEKEGIEEALKHLKVQAERNHGITCNVETDEIIRKINNRRVATNLYHITQEAIKNAVIHGEAKHIKIALIEHDQQLYLHVKDEGKGFDPEDAEGGMGIQIMKHRAEEIGGRLRIKKAKEGSGYTTCVTCTLPLESLEGE